MAIAVRKVRIHSRTWEHWVDAWRHHLTLENPTSPNQYRVEWQSGDYQNAQLLVDGQETQQGHWLELALQAAEMDGAPTHDHQIQVTRGRYFVMFPFYAEQMDDDDRRQLLNLPPGASLPQEKHETPQRRPQEAAAT